MNTHPQSSVQGTIAIVIIMAVICLTAIAIKPGLLPTIVEPTPTVVLPTSSISNIYQPEVLPLPTDTPAPTQTATSVPTNTSAPTRTPVIPPTLMLSYGQLPDLTVTSISDPVCATEYEGTKLRFSIYVRNIGRARTRYFGSFVTDVHLILGQSRYSLDEWATEFNGVIGTSIVEVANLNPEQDIQFTVVIDIKGNKDFGIEVVANSGENPIREADVTNNTLIKYYSVYCY